MIAFLTKVTFLLLKNDQNSQHLDSGSKLHFDVNICKMKWKKMEVTDSAHLHLFMTSLETIDTEAKLKMIQIFWAYQDRNYSQTV